jgi:ElaB/YqjD/DUF883 family membrane-anchored ribosome-binding protein
MKNTSNTVNVRDLQDAVKILQGAANGQMQNFEDEIKQDIAQVIDFSKRISSKLQKSAQQAENSPIAWAADIVSSTSEKLHAVKDVAQEQISEVKATASEKLQQADASIHNQPWAFIGGAALLGLACGFLLSKSNSSHHKSQ